VKFEEKVVTVVQPARRFVAFEGIVQGIRSAMGISMERATVLTDNVGAELELHLEI
jgi:hypothetical protein